ncbi:hypothetical protein Sjap_010179 [Stephania japonica]|uniref:Uncharacterized protein n=1 Tax=Stephania japonica TaxID=461633 RepID=A0AAP0JB46_9MAGN
MLCACSGEQFKFEDAPESPESLATRDFSASCLSSRTGDWETKLEESQVDDIESTLKEALSLNYEEARALLGRLEYQRGNFDAALQVFQGINVRSLAPRMTEAIVERTRQRRSRSKSDYLQMGVMSLHSVSLLLEAMFLKAKSLEALGCPIEAAKECKSVLDTVESALPNGMPEGFPEDSKLQEMLHKTLELLPKLWKQVGNLHEAIIAYRRALAKPWNLDPRKHASMQKDLAALLIYGGVEASIPLQLHKWGSTTPKNNMEEAILLLFILMRKIASKEIHWDTEIMDHLTYVLAVSGQFEFIADHLEQALPGIYNRSERWYLLALCYSAAGQDEVALNLLKKVTGHSESKREPHLPSLLLGAKLCSQTAKYASKGMEFAKRAIDFTTKKNMHCSGRAHELLGICCGSASRVPMSDSQRVLLHKESLRAFNHAAMPCSEDPELIFNLALENSVQRNLKPALEGARLYSDMIGGSSCQGWKLLVLILSAEKRFKDAETIVNLALDETGTKDQLEFLRLKAMLKVAQDQPRDAMETYRNLLALIQTQRRSQNVDTNTMVGFRDLELEAWLDLANIYTDIGSSLNAETCIEKAKSILFYSPMTWHAKGKLLEAQALGNEALAAFSISLSVNPDYVPSMVSAAGVLRRLGKESLPIARSFLMNALQLEPTNHEAWLHMGFLSKMEGSPMQAADFFQAAYELEESDPIQNFV